MLKKLAFLALILGFTSMAPAMAEDGDNPWLDAGGTGEKSGNKSAETDKTPAYEHKNEGRQTVGQFGVAQKTAAQQFDKLKTRSSTPLIFAGQNTYISPANMAYMTEHHSMIGGKLPETKLDSFVHKAGQNGMAEFIYGDEGTQGPPPYDFFMTIQTGGVEATTGHPSDAPSAWY
jgi:hypothetical protein